MSRNRRRVVPALAGLAALATLALPAQAGSTDKELIAHGRYLVRIAGCNDCHTPGYAQTGGKVAEKDWLVGDSLGWRGPWGTTYAANLRLALQGMSEAQWLAAARSVEYRPPMPWFALRDMTERDLRAIYRYVRSLGPAGAPAPAYVPPGTAPGGPVVLFPSPPQ